MNDHELTAVSLLTHAVNMVIVGAVYLTDPIRGEAKDIADQIHSLIDAVTAA